MTIDGCTISEPAVAPRRTLGRPLRRRWRRRGLAVGLAALLAAGLAACGPSDTVFPEDYNRRTTGDAYGQPGSVLGEGGFNLFGGESQTQASVDSGGGIGVNSFLWRASLDTISFMPLASADPFGGVIITDWYSPPESENERFKINVYILGRELRADGVRAAVFRQTQLAGGDWVDAEVEETTGTDLENAILSRARQLRIATIQ